MIRFARRIGCAILLLVAGAALWHFRDHWLPWVKDQVSERAPEPIREVIP